MKNSLTLLLLTPALLLVGCGGGAPKPAATADAAVMQVVDSLEQNDPSGFWHMLPASYQTQANEVLHEFAEKAPADVYDEGAALLQKLEKVLTTQKDLILESPMLAASPVDVSANYDQVVGMLGAITSSDLMSVQKMKKADIGQLMKSIGGKIMDTAAQMEIDPNATPDDVQDFMEFKNQLSTLEAELVSEDADVATVLLSIEGEEPEEVEFVKIEGKWLPKEIAENWSEMIAEAKAELADFEISPQQAAQIKMGMNMADTVLDQLLEAETPQEFQQAIMSVIGMPGGM